MFKSSINSKNIQIKRYGSAIHLNASNASELDNVYSRIEKNKYVWNTISPTFKLKKNVFIFFFQRVYNDMFQDYQPTIFRGFILLLPTHQPSMLPTRLMQLGLAMLRRRGAAMAVVDGEEAPPGWYPVVSNGSGSAEAPEFLGQNLNPNNTKIGK